MQLKIGRTTLRLTFSFASIITLMLLLCDEEIVLISLFSSLFHEGGHLFFMLLFSDAPKLIVFGSFGIRIERDTCHFLGYGKEALIAFGGVFGNGILALCALCFYLFCKSSFALKLLCVNVFIAAFNLIPLRQLDAGRCLNAIFNCFAASEKAEGLLDVISFFTCVMLVLICILYNVFFGLNVSFIAVTIYLTIISNLKEFKNDK